jgi:hypothetical protein
MSRTGLEQAAVASSSSVLPYPGPVPFETEPSSSSSLPVQIKKTRLDQLQPPRPPTDSTFHILPIPPCFCCSVAVPAHPRRLEKPASRPFVLVCTYSSHLLSPKVL